MSLYVHRAERADRLAIGLAELLSDPPADVFADEVVAVPARGVERWLTQRLSHRLGRGPDREDGVCAGVRFPSPTALVAEVVGVGHGRSGTVGPAAAGGADRDPWAPESLSWPLLEVIDDCGGEAWCTTLGAHLGMVGAGDPERSGAPPDHRRARRYAVARRLAGLFDSYAVHRPKMLTAWASGDDTDGFGAPLPTDLAWQAQLWRLVRVRIGGPDPVQRLAAALDRLRADPADVALPDRLSLFGATRLATSQLQVLSALSESRDVHLWLPHPSPAMWERVAPLVPAGLIRRRDDPSAAAPQHPLLSSLGRDSRELQLTLAAAPYVDTHHAADPDNDGADESGHPVPPTLLQQLQADLRDDRRPDPASVLTIAADDRSVQVHACHGSARQVEVLREVIVGLLAADPTLEPRDVLVMCPDIEVYAPLISAAFGLADVVAGGHPAHQLRVRLADRALTQTNPLLATVARMLELADGRVTGSQVLDLAAWGPVRRRFGFGDDELETVAAWVTHSGVRWGLDAGHRAAYGLDRYGQNTWRAGLDRILLGVAMADEDRWLGLALPLDDVGSSDVELAGRLAELLDRLEAALDRLTGEHPLDEWLTALATAVESLTSVTESDRWQTAELHRELGDVAAGAGDRSATAMLGLADLRALLSGRLGGRPTRANFRTGTLTVCTMVPMRSVPHRVICLLGLDDGVFPRGARLDGDDVLARDPAVGERDPRGEDRQLMLDAVLAATDHLVITYTGADERTGAKRPPAVPLGELLDALDDTASRVGGAPVRGQVLVRHPLQPFDARNVTPGALGATGPFSFDHATLAAARSAAGSRTRPAPFLSGALPPAAAGVVELTPLISMLQRPVRGFLEQRLDVAVRFEEAEPSDSLGVELDALEQWAIGDRLLRHRLAGADADTAGQAEWRRGVLPPGLLGARTLDQIADQVHPLVARTGDLRAPERRTVDVVVDLGDGREVRGSVPGVHGTRLVSIGYSRLSARARLRAWIELVAVTASQPGVGWTATAVGRGTGGAKESTLGPLGPEEARDVLRRLIDLRDRARREPLPLALKTSGAYAVTRHSGRGVSEAVVAARREWLTDKFPGEQDDSWHVQVWGQAAPLDTLLAEPPAPGERWYGEDSRFGELACRLWFSLLDHEQIGPL